MDERMECTDQVINQAAEAETTSPAALEVPESPASYADMADEEVVAQCRTGDAVAMSA